MKTVNTLLALLIFTSCTDDISISIDEKEYRIKEYDGLKCVEVSRSYECSNKEGSLKNIITVKSTAR